MKKLFSYVDNFNSWLALRGTGIFGSMWMTYLFFLYGFAPIMFPSYMVSLLYWSNTVQLWSLPLLMVGQGLLAKVFEDKLIKAVEDIKETVTSELSLIKEELVIAKEERATLQQLVNKDNDIDRLVAGIMSEILRLEKERNSSNS